MTTAQMDKLSKINHQICQANSVRLFLDYDGTLADFTPTPAKISPDEQLIDLINRLVQSDKFLPAVISGRQLADMLALLPVKGLLLAGTYGAEIQLPDGSRITAVDFACIRPILEELLPRWSTLISGKQGFYLEDKGCALAMHARYATAPDAEVILKNAQAEIDQLRSGQLFTVHQGTRFLEIAPAGVSKAGTVAQIMEQFTPAGALPVYAGDDEMDEEAFIEVKRRGGLTLRVATTNISTKADVRLASYIEVRGWLAGLME